MDRKQMGLLKWPGGKEREIDLLKQYFPTYIDNYYEPFVGGGCVYLNTKAQKYYINDAYDELAEFYRLCLTENLDLKKKLRDIDNLWQDTSKFYHRNEDFFQQHLRGRHGSEKLHDFSRTIAKLFMAEVHSAHQPYFEERNLSFEITIQTVFYNKLRNIIKHEMKRGCLNENDLKKNIVSALKAAVYTFIREVYNSFRDTPTSLYNNTLYIASFYFIRNYCYSSMFRFNKAGKFNVPYGGISYNNNLLTKKIEHIFDTAKRAKYLATRVSNLDFEAFMLTQSYKPNDFIFLDPPYDTKFSSYATNTFDETDQRRLANVLLHTKTRWLLITKRTKLISTLYDQSSLNILEFSKKYQVNFKNRNSKITHHLVIRNYVH